MEKLPPVICTLSSFDAASGIVTTIDGKTMPMLRVILKVDKQDGAGRHPTEQWPDVWLEPHTAAAMSEALLTALWRHLPAEAEKLGLVRPDSKAVGDLS